MAKDLTKKREVACVMFMQNYTLTSISEKIEVSKQTLTKWCSEDRWRERRAALKLTRPEISNKILLAVNKQMERINESGEDFDGDSLIKAAKTIVSLDGGASVVNIVEVFIAFARWLNEQADTDREITAAFISCINRYQDKFLLEKMNGGK